MATLTHEESRRLYSWWWNSHISPKNSKWLQENLSDMDMKVKSMIKLIEEDADSFARRAEMYYKKRPELMKLVEEFYRAYRALAERYDHATGALRQAHRTIEETFPNQIPFALSDESPGSFVSTEAASRTREMSPPIHALFDYDDSLKDDFNMSSQYQSIKRGYYDKNDALTNKKGLDQFNQRPGSEEETTHVKSSEGSASKGSHFLDEEQNNSEFNMQEASQLTKDNEYLKSQIISQSLRAETSEAEVQGLKEVISQLNSEKEAALIQSNLSLEYISKLETEISQSKDNFQKLNNEMQTVTGKLNFAEEQHLLLGNSNQVLQLELDAFNQRSNKLQEDLNKHQEEFELLKNSLQDEHIRFLQAEKASLSFEKLLEQSQEEIGLLNLEIQNGTEKLKDTEMIRMGLEKELQELKEENGSLNEKHVASSLEITSLQDEMLFLKDSKAKLDDEFSFHIEEKEGLEKELSCLQEERDELEQNCRRLMEQVETANSNVGFLEGLVKELQNGNEELQEICKDRETEKVTHLENLKCMEKISEKNMALENSLSDANDEIEGLREKIKALEEFCESLCSKVNLYLSENTTLASQVETDSHDMKQLSEKNTFLEKSLWDANVELESLREKLKVLEESCQSLCAQKSNLLFEKSSLIQQIEETIQNLGNLKACYAELDLKCLNLENERNMVLRQALEFEESLKHEREEHETLILSLVQSSKSQLNNLENRIILLQEEGQLREEDAEVVQHKIMDYQIEIFILQRCLCDMNESNLILSLECQNLAEASKYAENVISELKQEVLTQEEKLTSSAQRSEKLREWIQLMLAEICLEKHCGSLDGTEDDALLHLALHEIEVLLKHFSDTRDENQQLILEKSFIITILKQFALDMADLTVDKNAAEGEYKIKTKKLLLAQNKELELLAENKQLKVELQASNQRQEEHKAEIEVLLAQLRDLEEASGTLKSEVCNLCEENQSLEKKLYESKEKKEILEEENNVIFAEALTLDSLYVISRGSNTDKMHELQMTRNDLCCLQGVKDGLADDILMLTEKFMAIEIENVCLKDAVLSSGECQKLFMIMEDDLRAARNVCKQMYLEIESGKNLLAQKDVELSQALENKSAELCKNIECLHMDTGALVLREELESKIPNLSEENAQINSVIACIHQENDRLNRELCRLHKQVEDLRSREEHLSFEVQKGVDEVNLCESEIAKLLHDVQITTLDAAIFEEKLLELLITCESFEISAIVQRERLHKEITLRTAIVDELKEKIDRVRREKRGLKKEVDAYLFLVPALSDDFNSLEEHITTLAKHHRSHFIKRKDNQLMSPQHNKNSREPIEVHAETMPAGIVELRKLHVKVKALQKVVIDTRRFSEQEMSEFNPILDAEMKDIEVLKSKRNSSVQEEAEISKYIKQLENRHEPGIGHKPHKGDDEISVAKSEQMIKDIQLDHGLSSSRRGNDFNSYGFSVSENAGTNDQDLDMWGATESECSNRIQNASSSVRWRDTTNSSQEWNRKVIEGLSSDSQRLQVLQTSVQELKRNIETSETNFPTDFEFDTVKSQLKEAEKSITHLINANSRLAKKANDFSADSDTTVGDQNEIIKSRRKISDRGRRVSEKIGRLELELNKVKYILLKIKEENEAKRVKISDRRKVMLKDYLNGRTESRKQKKIHCRCMRPKTRDD